MDSILLFSLIGMLTVANMSWYYVWQVVLFGIAIYVPAFVLTPRLVLSLRELYARDLRRGCGSDIDTAFGLRSSSRATVGSQIAFAEGGQNVGEEQGEERDDAHDEGRDAGQDEGQDAEQGEEIRTVNMAMIPGAGGGA